MKKIIIPIILIIAIIVLAVIFLISKKDNKEISDNIQNINDNNTVQNNDVSNIVINGNEVEDEKMDTVYIKVNNQILDVELENNLATKELKEKLKDRDIVIEAHDYGGFEKIGNLGFSLPREDTNITTSAGDIVLYQGNQISIFYNSNTWNYTRLGRIQDIKTNELKNILGNGDIIVTFSQSR